MAFLNKSLPLLCSLRSKKDADPGYCAMMEAKGAPLAVGQPKPEMPQDLLFCLIAKPTFIQRGLCCTMAL